MGCSPSFTWWMHDCFPQDPPLMDGVSAGNRSLWIRFNLPSVWHKENNEQTEPLLSWQWSRSQRADAYLWLRQSRHISFYLSNLKTLLIYLISKKSEFCCLIEGTTFLVLLNTRASESSPKVEKRQVLSAPDGNVAGGEVFVVVFCGVVF